MKKVIKDDDNEGVNDKSKDMNKAEVNKRDTQEDIQSDGLTLDRDESWWDFVINIFDDYCETQIMLIHSISTFRE